MQTKETEKVAHRCSL